jgi:Sec-independent protein translocase protein TatA
MQKNKILLASLISLFSINATTNAWMPNSTWLPNKDNAMIYAVGGLAVTSAFLLHKVYKLSARLDAQADAIDAKASKVAAVDQTNFAQVIRALGRAIEASKRIASDMRSEFNQHKATATIHSQTHDNTAALLMKRLADLEDNRTKQQAEFEQAKKALSGLTASPLDDKAKAQIVKDVTARVLILEQSLRCLQSNHGAHEVSLSLLKTDLEHAATKEELNKQIKELKEQLAAFATKQALEAATNLAKSEAQTATRATQKAQEELTALQAKVTELEIAASSATAPAKQ